MAEESLSRPPVFAGAVPEIYDRLMVPLNFAPFAEDMARRIAALRPRAVLETAAGSGVVTRALAPLLAGDAQYLVTDLNAPMLARAQAMQPPDPRLTWAVADALKIDAPDAGFDVVFCQFGAMFFPDKAKGFAEARRLLRPGGHFLFSTWDAIGTHGLEDAVDRAMAALFPDDPPDFFARLPHGYHQPDRIAADMAAAGFADPRIEVLVFLARAGDARQAATALCQGTPLRGEIEARAPGGLDEVTAEVARRLAEAFGPGPIAAPMSALLVTAMA